MRHVAWSLALAVPLLAGCVMATGSATGPAPAAGSDVLPPPGYGTLHQDQISVNLSRGDLRLMVTPLAESIIRVTSPDTYQRLSNLVAAHQDQVTQSPSGASSTLFLVSLFTNASGIGFEPQELELISGGVRMRPSMIIPLTPGWSRQRLEQRRMDQALYVFSSSVDLESDDLVVLYKTTQSSQWRVILPAIRNERARARARARAAAGGTASQASNPYLAILR